MVIDDCTLNKQICMAHHFNQNVTADAKRYHTCLYVKCTIIYDHICTQIWRSVSVFGHGNEDLKPVDMATQVRIRPEPAKLTQPLNRSALSLIHE